MPMPVAANMVMSTGRGLVMPQASTPPRRGPLHGVASSVVNMPVLKACMRGEDV